MFRYYLALGFLSLRRNPMLTLLMVLTLSVGVAASMTTLTILKGMSGDPIPHKSERLLVPQLDNLPPSSPTAGYEPPDQLTYRDAMALWQQARGLRQTPLYGIDPAVDTGRNDLPPFFAEGLAVGRDFFAMFDVPMRYGQPWTDEDDRDGKPVAVIGRALAERLFGADVNPVGRHLRIGEAEFAISGVTDHWQPLPKYYRLVGSQRFDDFENVYLPFRTALAMEMGVNGNISCSADHEPGMQGLMASECNWVQYWVELADAGDRASYSDYLAAYTREQQSLGRFSGQPQNRLRDVREWLQVNGVVSDEARTANWLSLAFLLVCVVNTVSLLLAKFSARPGEIGVRRALGATRTEIFRQYLTEAGVIGLVGAGLGIAWTLAAMAFLRRFDPAIALIARLELDMTLITVVVSLAAALLAGLLPTWRACRITPALQLKSQ
ncbi:MAG TPA: ABC transporter permease [Arenimonas sp.]|nr:ABC transporter permease [Arenimonas sp.]